MQFNRSAWKLVNSGRLTLVTTGNFPPLTFMNPQNQVDGYSIDVGVELAKALGLELKNETVDFVAELQGLASGKYDLADSGLRITPEREQTMIFTDPVVEAGFAVYTLANDANVKGTQDLRDKIVGAIKGSLAEKWTMDNQKAFGIKEITAYPGFSEQLLDLQNKRIDAAATDNLVAAYFVKTQPGKIRVAISNIEPVPLQMALAKGNETLRDDLNKVIAGLRNDGTLLKYQEKWWGEKIGVPAPKK